MGSEGMADCCTPKDMRFPSMMHIATISFLKAPQHAVFLSRKVHRGTFSPQANTFLLKAKRHGVRSFEALRHAVSRRKKHREAVSYTLQAHTFPPGISMHNRIISDTVASFFSVQKGNWSAFLHVQRRMPSPLHARSSRIVFFGTLLRGRPAFFKARTSCQVIILDAECHRMIHRRRGADHRCPRK